MEESKELQGVYKIFRTAIYVSLLIEFFMYAIDPEVLDYPWDVSLYDAAPTAADDIAAMKLLLVSVMERSSNRGIIPRLVALQALRPVPRRGSALGEGDVGR